MVDAAWVCVAIEMDHDVDCERGCVPVWEKVMERVRSKVGEIVSVGTRVRVGVTGRVLEAVPASEEEQVGVSDCV